jgi:hypothetical protein
MTHEQGGASVERQAPRARRASLAPAGAILAAAVLLLGCASGRTNGKQPGSAHKARVEQRWGVHVLGIRLSAAGYMLDFRYRVLDAARARAVLDRKANPYLIDDASGRTLVVPHPPKLGPMRNTGLPVAGRNYFVVFGNPAKFVKRGQRVTVVIGDVRIPDLIVE